MEDIKNIIAKNITDLRVLNNMTQAELGEKLNYSDKTVSKWERGESTPDISVLIEISKLFGVSLDYLVKADCINEIEKEEKKEEKNLNLKAIAYISCGCVWLIAIFAFIITSLISKTATFQWLYIAYALPIFFIVSLVFNSIWFNPRHNYIIVSALMWSILVSVHVSFLHFGIDVTLVYLLGVVGQIIIVLWSFIRKPKTKRK